MTRRKLVSNESLTLKIFFFILPYNFLEIFPIALHWHTCWPIPLFTHPIASQHDVGYKTIKWNKWKTHPICLPKKTHKTSTSPRDQWPTLQKLATWKRHYVIMNAYPSSDLSHASTFWLSLKNATPFWLDRLPNATPSKTMAIANVLPAQTDPLLH